MVYDRIIQTLKNEVFIIFEKEIDILMAKSTQIEHTQRKQWKLSFKQTAKHSVWKCLSGYLVVKNGKKAT